MDIIKRFPHQMINDISLTILQHPVEHYFSLLPPFNQLSKASHSLLELASCRQNLSLPKKIDQSQAHPLHENGYGVHWNSPSCQQDLAHHAPEPHHLPQLGQNPASYGPDNYTHHSHDQ